jgi:hypothetical protein
MKSSIAKIASLSVLALLNGADAFVSPHSHSNVALGGARGVAFKKVAASPARLGSSSMRKSSMCICMNSK